MSKKIHITKPDKAKLILELSKPKLIVSELLKELDFDPKYGLFFPKIKNNKKKQTKKKKKDKNKNKEKEKEKPMNSTSSETESIPSLQTTSEPSEEEFSLNEKQQLSLEQQLQQSQQSALYNPQADFQGRFLDDEELVGDYLERDLELRVQPKEKVSLRITFGTHLNNSMQSFSPNTEIKNVLNFFAEKDKRINPIDYGVVFTYNESFRKDGFINLTETKEKEKAVKEILECQLRFGVWAKFKKGYTLSGYLSKLENKFDSVQLSLRPIIINLILPDNRKMKLLLDLNCTAEEVIQKLVKNLNFKTQVMKLNKKYSIIYSLYKIDYGMEGGKKVIAQLQHLEENKRFSDQGVLPSNTLKIIKKEKILEKQTNIQNVNPKTNFWREFGIDIQNLTWFKQDKNSKSTSKIATRNDLLFNKISGISVNRLIGYLTTPGFQTPGFLDIFLVLLPTFTEESIVIDRLLERFDVPSIHPKTKRSFLNTERVSIQKLVLEVILVMIKNGINTASKEKILKTLSKAELTNENEEIHSIFNKVNDYLKSNNEENEKDKGKENESNSNKTTALKVKQNKKAISKLGSSQDLTFEAIQETEIAIQLTLIVQEFFKEIKPNELFNKAWTKSDKNEIAPNITNMIKGFNFLADWVSTLILSESDEKERLKKLIKCIKIANELKKLNNFNDMFAIISGLQNSAVLRIESTWKKLPNKISEIYNQLDELTDVLHGCKTLREMTQKTDPPCIPYLASYLVDLTYIGDLPDEVDNGLINWRKKMRMWEVISEIKRLQLHYYDFVLVKSVKNFINSQTIYTENEMWDKSIEIEKPPNMN
ncbi:guanine nucleotide exchange factor [Anaeramoeba flamelloides]|uniref:Guanine nucleotide exchange factor n=1 Tax=Anaeramoeba flamelloides TaxID=1746091 RepID=A0ABQ8Z5E4_9EUKA|nr:guanine nucleotide exchange factor [Anaeramoeba flamelloides]